MSENTKAAWKSLNDVEWTNIVDHDGAWTGWGKDAAVHEAVKMTEAKLKELNAATPHAIASAAPSPVQTQPVARYHEAFAHGALAARSHEGNGGTINEEIIAAIGEKNIYRVADDEDYELAGLDRAKKPAATPATVPADLISQIVDRDTPPDSRNEVIDHDIRGNPITRGDVAAMSRSATVPAEPSDPVASNAAQASVPDGWPTNKMIQAGWDAGLSGKIGSGFRAMLAAAPTIGTVELADCGTCGGQVTVPVDYFAPAAIPAQTGTTGELPPLPPFPAHPEPHTYAWSELERLAIQQYGEDCARAAPASPAGATEAASEWNAAIKAMERAKKLKCWDGIPHALHVELSEVFANLVAASLKEPK